MHTWECIPTHPHWSIFWENAGDLWIIRTLWLFRTEIGRGFLWEDRLASRRWATCPYVQLFRGWTLVNAWKQLFTHPSLFLAPAPYTWRQMSSVDWLSPFLHLLWGCFSAVNTRRRARYEKLSVAAQSNVSEKNIWESCGTRQHNIDVSESTFSFLVSTFLTHFQIVVIHFLYWFPRAAVINYYHWGGLTQQKFIFQQFWGRSLKSNSINSFWGLWKRNHSMLLS